MLNRSRRRSVVSSTVCPRTKVDSFLEERLSVPELVVSQRNVHRSGHCYQRVTDSRSPIEGQGQRSGHPSSVIPSNEEVSVVPSLTH